MHNLQGHTKNVTIAIFNSHSTEVLTTALDRTIKIWDVSSGKLKMIYPYPLDMDLLRILSIVLMVIL